MCQSTKNGGKRCGAHANATLAAEMQIAKTTGAPIQKVKQILAMLRKKGKSETAPTAEEVKEYSTQQQFKIENDPSLSKHDKRILSNRWNKAANEEISGGTWYAIKNGLFAVVALLKKRVVAGGLVGLMAFTSVAACTGGVKNEVPAPPTTSTSTPVAPAPSESPVEQTPFSVEGISIGERVGSGYEERNELIAGDQSSLLEGVKVPSEVSELFSEEKIQELNQDAATFVIEEIIDSGYLHESDPSKVAQWYDNIKPKADGFLTEQLPALKKTVSEDSQPVPSNIGSWRGVPDAERPTKTGAYFDDIKMRIEKMSIISYEGVDYLSFDYNVETKRPVINPDASDTKQYDEYMRFTAGITPSPQGTGKIAGYSQQSNTRTVEQGKEPDFS